LFRNDRRHPSQSVHKLEGIVLSQGKYIQGHRPLWTRVVNQAANALGRFTRENRHSTPRTDLCGDMFHQDMPVFQSEDLADELGFGGGAAAGVAFKCLASVSGV
jgi:hypothetical protein